MKIQLHNVIIFVFLIIILPITSCKRTEKEHTPSCPPTRHFDPQKGCICDSNSREFWGKCYNISADTYYAKTDSCKCLTEVLVTAPRDTTDQLFSYSGLRFHFPNAQNSPYVDYKSYFIKNDGDSISGHYPFNMLTTVDVTCTINGKKHVWFFSGKFQGNDTISGWFKWYLPVPLPFPAVNFVDSCKVNLIRVK